MRSELGWGNEPGEGGGCLFAVFGIVIGLVVAAVSAVVRAAKD